MTKWNPSSNCGSCMWTLPLRG